MNTEPLALDQALVIERMQRSVYGALPFVFLLAALSAVLGGLRWWFESLDVLAALSAGTGVLLTILAWMAKRLPHKHSEWLVNCSTSLLLVGAFTTTLAVPEPAYYLFYVFVLLGAVYLKANVWHLVFLSAFGLFLAMTSNYLSPMQSDNTAMLYVLFNSCFIPPILWVARWRAAKRAFQEAEQARVTSLQRVSAGVAHTFNNALQGVIGYTNLQAETSETDEETLNAVNKSLERSVDVGRTLAAYAGHSANRVEAISLSDIFQWLQEYWRTSPDSIRIEWRQPDPETKTEGDFSKLCIALNSVILNALEASPDSVVTISAEMKDCIEIAVQDTGPGIEPSSLPLLFDPFYSTKGFGRGLGLTLAYGLVKGQKGDLSVVSSPSDATTFSVTLPAIA